MNLLQIKGRQAELIENNKLLFDVASKDGWTDEARAAFDANESEFNTLYRMAEMEGKTSTQFHIEQEEQVADDVRDEQDLREWLLGEGPATLDIDLTSHERSFDSADEAYRFDLSKAKASADEVVDTNRIAPMLVARRRMYNWVERTNSPVITTSNANPLIYVSNDDTGNSAAAASENTAPSAGTDPTFVRHSLSTAKISTGVVNMTRELIRDSAFNVVSEVSKLLGTRMGRKMAKDYSDHLVADMVANLRVGIPSGTKQTSAKATHISELAELEKYVEEAYHSSSLFVFHPAYWYEIANVQNSTLNARLIGGTNWADGVPRRLNGYPVILNNNMNAAPFAAAQDGNVIGVFGSLEYFQRRHVGGMRLVRIDQDATYIQKDAIGLIAFQEYGDVYTHPAPSAGVSVSNTAPLVGIATHTA